MEACGQEGDRGTVEVLKDLMSRENVDAVCNCCDAGREGEAIFRLVYEKAGCTKPIERLWISSMEESAIREGLANMKPGSDYDDLYASATCRQQADWLVGLNGTRLFSVLHGKKLKVGRVQSPTLAMLVERDTQIMTFKKVPYYTRISRQTKRGCSIWAFLKGKGRSFDGIGCLQRAWHQGRKRHHGRQEYKSPEAL